ncbi:hypothetical protein HS088_TW04G00105 [Tripterygium wilfordii]|uniref:Serine-rich protein-related n=1 Tax=Tripterygium wilfordii TaxID=458696 RepID=A0A7J7DP90_TRIWF|nr:uncharacterized protein LOC119996763 [Tripterygium wilfordii]KAF5748155.1 hypothetical protein HS088_TW04G00105 [Tripterygium wilfordii]
MAVSSSRRSSGPVLRSVSPSGRFHTSNTSYSISSSSSAFASSTGSSFSSPSSTFFNHSHHRSASPTRVNLYSAPRSTSFRFSIDRSTSPGRSIALSKQNNPISLPKKTCMCSPTTHRGSFRCSLHKNISSNNGNNNSSSYPSNRLNMRRSAMTNSLVRIGGVEGEWVRRALTALIRPSSHQQRRRAAFQPRQSRLSVMSKAEDL